MSYDVGCGILAGLLFGAAILGGVLLACVYGPTPQHRAWIEWLEYQTRTKHESHIKPAPREEDRDE